MKTKELVKKSRSREAKSRMPEQSRPAARRVLVNSLTLDSLTFAEQTGNVYENKGQGQGIKNPRVECQSKVGWQPGACLLTP
jgi:hypothetical protein